MSTAELYLDDEEIAEFIRETKEAPQYFYGDEGQEYGVCPFITFYVYHFDEDFFPLVEKMSQIYRSLNGIIDKPFKKILKSSTETWFSAGDKRLPDMLEDAKKSYNKGEDFWIQATDRDIPTNSALWAIDGRVQCLSSAMAYTTLKITFRHSWHIQNKDRWENFVQDCLTLLEPEQCYSGFEIGTTGAGAFGAYESDVIERICADYFYGLDIDHPSKMGFQFHRDEDGWVDVTSLGAGLRTPTWCFLLSPIWLDKLRLNEAGVRQALSDPRITITPLPRSDGRTSLWVKLGELSLYPVEDGVPELPVLANELIRPVRCNDLRLITLDPWEGDPNPRFDFQSSPRWIARFDENSQWPSKDKRVIKPPSPPPLRGLPGETVPQSGIWWTPAIPGEAGRKQFNKGDNFPDTKHTDYGAVVWYLDSTGG